MDLGLGGRTAIVCGASSGIGLAIAEGLAAEGANVAMFARRRDLLEREADRLGARYASGFAGEPSSSASASAARAPAAHPGVIAVRGDVTVPADLERLVERTVAAFGGVDVLVNNSGGPPRGPALAITPESIEAAVELLLVSAVRLTSLCLPHLERSGRGRVINIESSTVREPADDLALSNAVRPGVVGWAKTLAREVGPKGITVNTIAPGRIDTERLREAFPSEDQVARIPLGRVGEPREIADVVCFLASERAGYVTGATIAVDGGLTRGLL
jgi:3-oxoacyl-[acyl-carrier protein] reductase